MHRVMGASFFVCGNISMTRIAIEMVGVWLWLCYFGERGYDFAILSGREYDFLFWQVENMILIFLRNASPAIYGRDLIIIRYVSLFWEWLYHLLLHPVKG